MVFSPWLGSHHQVSHGSVQRRTPGHVNHHQLASWGHLMTRSSSRSTTRILNPDPVVGMLFYAAFLKLNMYQSFIVSTSLFDIKKVLRSTNFKNLVHYIMIII